MVNRQLQMPAKDTRVKKKWWEQQGQAQGGDGARGPQRAAAHSHRRNGATARRRPAASAAPVFGAGVHTQHLIQQRLAAGGGAPAAGGSKHGGTLVRAAGGQAVALAPLPRPGAGAPQPGAPAGSQACGAIELSSVNHSLPTHEALLTLSWPQAQPHRYDGLMRHSDKEVMAAAAAAQEGIIWRGAAPGAVGGPGALMGQGRGPHGRMAGARMSEGSYAYGGQAHRFALPSVHQHHHQHAHEEEHGRDSGCNSGGGADVSLPPLIIKYY